MRAAPAERGRLLIDNEWRPSATDRWMEVVNPATEEVIAEVPEASPEDVDLAVAAARRALAGPWGSLPARERGRLVRKLADRLMERADEVSRLETLHNGKPISESRRIEIPAAGQSRSDLREPAPGLKLLPAAGWPH